MVLSQNTAKTNNSPAQRTLGGPTIFVIFGATGDLARKKIFPSFFELFNNDLLPKNFLIIASARSNYTTASFVDSLKDNIKVENSTKWEKFAKLVEYHSSDVSQNIGLDKLITRFAGFESEIKKCTQRIYYMAISPFIYEEAFENLGKTDLNLGCTEHNVPAKIVVEKPFGYDLKSAKSLNEKLSKYFSEPQIYRIDHFLGKETVQNIFAFRFGNELFEPIWNRNYIDHVQITLAENVGVEKRGEYYDKSGALRDIVQNHLLRLLATVTMEEPSGFDHSSIRKRRMEIIKSIKIPTAQEIESSTVRGQYENYRSEEKVDTKSTTETYALVKLFIENERWRGVPFYLRTGKKLMGKVTSIIFQFKEQKHALFEKFWERPMPNHITLQIQPNEGIGIRLVAKKPGLTTELEPVDMEFCYKTSFDVPQPDAYERLILDIIVGDQTLFLGEIGKSWEIIDPIEEVWAKGKPKLEVYRPGTWGPGAADELIARDGRQWLAPLLSICKI